MQSPQQGSSARFRVLFLLFFLSGISGLIYESIWSRYIKQFVGSAATAQILVLSLFMGGMSLGALLSGRFVARTRSPVVVYGVIEGLIGVYALAFPHIADLVMRLAYDSLFPALGGGAAVELAKWSLAGLLILPPCVLLGTTFPLMSVGILRRDLGRSGEILSMLYFTNSLGASFGALFSGFVLVAKVGLPGALMVAAALNILIMLIAMRDRTPTDAIEARTTDGVAPSSKVTLYLLVALGTGLSSFMYEIGWIRLLSTILGAATHSFEIMLSVFILGLAMGGLWVRKRMDKFRRPEMALAYVQVIMGLSAIATLPAYRLGVWAMGGLLSDQWIEMWSADGSRTVGLWMQFNVLKWLICVMMMFPAAFCAGMTLPLLTHVMLKRGQPEGVVGKVYGFNTLGAITGAVLAGLVLMPIIGLKGVLVLGALVDLVLGMVLIRGEIALGRAPGNAHKLLRNIAIGTVTAVGFGLLINVDPTVLTSTVFRNGRFRLPESYEVLSYVDGRTASVTVVKTDVKDGHHVIYTNGKPDASVVLNRWPEGHDKDLGPEIAGDEPNQFLVGLIPLMARPGSKHGALIGFGSGVTCHTLLSSPHLERLDTVEIEPEMVRGSSYFKPVNYRAYDDPRSHIHFDDAKAYFAWAGDKYDFIISEPTNPWVSGVSSLFTVEFYKEVKRYLKPGGLLAQWVQGYELSDDLMISVLSALDREFEDYLIVRIGSSDWVIISSADGPIGELDASVLGWPDAQESFELLGIHDIGQIDGLITANKQMLHPFLVDKVPNRDSHPILDTGAERARFLKFRAEFLHELRWTPAPVLEALGGIVRRPYPEGGIGDIRDPHILLETEQAALLMRRYGDPESRVGKELSAASMTEWRDATANLQLVEHPDWEGWFQATYDVYAETASHIDLRNMPWWREVLAVAGRADVPNDVRDGVDLLDALVQRDSERISAMVAKTIGQENFAIPLTLRTVAGVIALELRSAPAPERKAFVEKYMMSLGNGGDNEDYAYRTIRAYAARE
ncbi:MAG: spermidine synthase [Deltaproteobacteria bacterium]|nr:spermidine synthase [Nannocystaceae bacterium]